MTQSTPTANWYLAQLKPNAHQMARVNLERQGFETFLPLIPQTKRRGGRFETQLKPLFPGYIFVGRSAQKETWRSVNATRGVTRLVSVGDVPTRVPAGIMKALQQRFAEPGIDASNLGLETGDSVRLSAGPFADLIAKVESVSIDQRVWLLLNVMGRDTRISARPCDLHR